VLFLPSLTVTSPQTMANYRYCNIFFPNKTAPSISPQCPVLRSQNLGTLRPEKSWRPIVTLEVDGQHKHEIMLGVDGQNPNQREIMLLYVVFSMHLVNDPDLQSHHARRQTQIKLDVWHKSQSKVKSRKRRQFVASATMALGDVMKKQGTDPCEPSLTRFFHARCSRGLTRLDG
jgi:hypothetical protein